MTDTCYNGTAIKLTLHKINDCTLFDGGPPPNAGDVLSGDWVRGEERKGIGPRLLCLQHSKLIKLRSNKDSSQHTPRAMKKNICNS